MTLCHHILATIEGKELGYTPRHGHGEGVSREKNEKINQGGKERDWGGGGRTKNKGKR